MATGIDFASVVARTDLAALINADIGAPLRGGRWLCPFHDDSNPDLSVGRDGRRFKCWACGATGTAIDWIMLREGVSVVEAARVLDGAMIGLRTRPRPAPVPKVALPAAWEDDEWQQELDRIVCHAEGELWSPEGRPALDWLLQRGLSRETIRRFRLGFVPQGIASRPLEVIAKGGRPWPIWVPRGVTIPWVAPGSYYGSSRPSEDDEPEPRWVGVNVRRLADDDVFRPLPDGVKRYNAPLGSARGYAYPWAHIEPTQGHPPAMIVEGEFDALMVEQEVGHLVFAVTAGGAQQGPHQTAKDALGQCPWWLVCTDRDESGAQAAQAWFKLGGRKFRRMIPPQGKDISEFVAFGGDLASWLRAEVEQIRVRMTG